MNSTVSAILDAIATTYATLGLGLYNIETGMPVLPGEHPLAARLNQPNSREGPSQLMYKMAYQYKLTGNVFLLYTDKSSLNVLDSSSIEVDRSSVLPRYIDRINHKVYSDAEVAHIFDPRYDDGIIGHSALEINKDAVDRLNILQLYQDLYFKNTAGERLIINLDPDMTKMLLKDDKKKVFDAFVQANLLGPLNAGKPALAPTGSKIELIKQTTSLESQVELSKDSLKKDVANVLACPHYMITGEYGNNLDEQQTVYFRRSILSMSDILGEGLNHFLTPSERRKFNFKHDFGNLLYPSTEKLSAMLLKEIRGGVRTRNEARKILGLSPYIGEQTEVGDVLAWEANLVPALNEYLPLYFANAQKTINDDKEKAENANPNTK
jgi:HK97 family phage portal protein